jgi:hypothetical protein
MKRALFATLVLLAGCTSAISQQQLNAATKEDVEQLLEVTGARARVQQMWSQMAQQVATTAADSYRLKNPDATPLELRKVAEVTGLAFQSEMKVLSVDELVDAMIPVYQRHLTHADVQGIIDFYKSSAGQTYLSALPAIMQESMQAADPIVKKHLPEMQAAAEKAIQESVKAQPSGTGNASGGSGDSEK